MNKKIFISITLTIVFFIFIILFKGLFNLNTYTPNKILTEKVTNFTAKELYFNNDIELKELLSDKKFTILNIWSSWCVPCRAEHKYLMELKKVKNLNIIGINYKDKIDNAKKFISDFGNPYFKILVDLDGTKVIELGAYGVPETYIINNLEKKIIKKYIGPLDEIKLQEIIKILN